jgi:hypothetical protein
MATLLACLCLTFQSDTFRVDGPPFLQIGDQVDLEVKNIPKDSVVVWRLADGPAGSIETRPALNPDNHTVRGPAELTVVAIGRADAEFRFVATAERKGLRLATAEFRMRMGSLLTVRAWCHAVSHAAGGTTRPLDDCRRKALEHEVNRYLRPLGIAASLEAGSGVASPDWWFDSEGRFQPIGLKDGRKANTAAFNDLLRNDQPAGLNVYFVRDLYWEQVDQGFERKVTAHELLGVGLKEGRVVLDDGADAASLAHELGHALGLDDLKAKTERDRMMYWVRRDRSDFLFTYGEMKDARESAQVRLKKWSRSGVAASAPPKR